ncbi:MULTISPECIES: thioredoxin family protein [unclassified Pseudomonas]|uniref:thioredoxin family protein n=1 Tax=unclassified Pseudomonas TaxID=196821 RepID=UPI0030D749D2
MVSLKELFEIGQDFGSFVYGGLDSEVFAVHAIERKLSEGACVSHKTLERLFSVVGDYNLLVVGEMWCPDCHLSIPVFNYICQIQRKIDMSIISKGRGEEDLKERLGLNEILMPVVAVLDFDYQLVGTFVERPNFIVNDEGVDTLGDYKAGKHLEKTVSDILGVIEIAEGRVLSKSRFLAEWRRIPLGPVPVSR